MGPMKSGSGRNPSPSKPPWLVCRTPSGEACERIRNILRDRRLHTVCQEALCPNLGECFSRGTATFLILGDRCTRSCRFCAVSHGGVKPPDPEEPGRIAEAIMEMGLGYVVVTSVTRDDLPDGGAGHFAGTVKEIRREAGGVGIELLIPDFQGDAEALGIVVEAGPDVVNHNVETVPALYPSVRPQAVYERSLELLRRVAQWDGALITKSGLMLGLGESENEVLETLRDLREVHCRILTLGQYLRPSTAHLPVVRFLSPDEFSAWGREALRMGFSQVASGPLVRSSYRAGELFQSVRGQGR